MVRRRGCGTATVGHPGATGIPRKGSLPSGGPGSHLLTPSRKPQLPDVRKALPFQVPAAPPSRPGPLPTWTTWTPPARSESSSPPAAPRSPRSRRACPPSGTASAGSPGCAARKSPCSPVSASTTTSAWNAASSCGASEEVLDALCRALQLDDAERSHLYDLAAAQRQRPALRTPCRTRGTVPACLKRVLESMTGSPAFIRNGRLDILAVNELGRALYAPVHRRGPPGQHRPLPVPRPCSPP